MSLVGKVEFFNTTMFEYISYIYEKNQNKYNGIDFCKNRHDKRFTAYLVTRDITSNYWDSVTKLIKEEGFIQVQTLETLKPFDQLNFEEQNEVIQSLAKRSMEDFSSGVQGVTRSSLLGKIEVIKDPQGHVQQVIIRPKQNSI